jgi:hypothetical protein
MEVEILQDTSKFPSCPFRVRVETLKELAELAFLKKAVVIPTLPAWSKPKPASFLLSLQGRVLLKLLNAGIYIYEKKVGIWLESLKYYQS